LLLKSVMQFIEFNSNKVLFYLLENTLCGMLLCGREVCVEVIIFD